MGGPCNALFRMYYYDAKSGKCKKFVYGGCGGNQNKFGKMAECVATCKPEVLKNVSLKKRNWGGAIFATPPPPHSEFPNKYLDLLRDRNIQEIRLVSDDNVVSIPWNTVVNIMQRVGKGLSLKGLKRLLKGLKTFA